MGPGGGPIAFTDADIPAKPGADGISKGTTTWTADQQRKDVASIHEQEVDGEAKARAAVNGPQDAAEYAFKQHVDFYGRMNMVRPQWQQALNGVSAGMGDPKAIAAGHIPPSLLQAGALFKALRAQNPALLDKQLTDDNAKLMLEAYNNASTVGNMPDNSAWAYAASVAERKAKGELPSFDPKPADVDTAVKAVKGAGMIFDHSQDVTGDAHEAMFHTAQMLVWAGVPTDKALAQAAERVKQNFAIVNGRSVYAPDAASHPDFEAHAETQLHHVAAAYAEHNHLDSADDLFMAPVNGRTDAWSVHSKLTGSPVLDLGNNPVIVTQHDLDNLAKADAAQAQAARAQAVQGKLKSTTTPSAVDPITRMFTPRFLLRSTPFPNYNQDLLDEKHRNREGDIIPTAQPGYMLPKGIDLLGSTVTPAGGGPPSRGGSRGIRNRNPGNIEYGAFARAHGAVGSDGRFAIFSSPEEGRQAMIALLHSYQDRGLNTVRKMIDRYNPKSDGQPAHYIPHVAKALGVSPDAPIDLTDPDVANRMVSAMIGIETPS
jgi:hypothetical protein